MMLKAKAKYTVIASAHRSNLTAAANTLRHVESGFELAALGFDKHVDVMGYYRETGQDAAIELSRAIPVSSLDKVSQLATLFCGGYGQDCILAINNETKDVWLIDIKGLIMAKLGKWTPHAIKKTEWDAYTFDGLNYYTAE